MRNMLVPRPVPTVLGALAALATTAMLVIHCILAHSLLDWNTSVRVAAVLSSVLEAPVLVLLGWLIAADLRPWTLRSRSVVFNNLWFGASLLLCTVAAAASVAAVVRLSNSSPTTLPSHILGSTATGFLVGSSVALGLSFALQLIFLVIHYITSRAEVHDRADSPESGTGSRRSPLPQVKSIPYDRTSPATTKAQEAMPMEPRSPPSPPGSSGGETMSSFRSSMSHFVRPISSRTRLLSSSQRSSRRPSSLESNAYHERSSVATEDAFDTWDTSAVDPQNRQTVLENSSSPIPGRFLETIPASPTTSRSPSPGTPLDLEPPRTRRRSRSYSPAETGQTTPRPAFTEHQSVSESHIHPLFRSGSPIPPPAATPGTVVTAAPNAGQVISDRQSIRTLHRMRSGSLPTAPSPLSRQGSFDDFHRGRAEKGSVSPSVSPELREEPEEEEEQEPKETERKMTPPIPDWILSAGSRLSMAGYNSRKSRSGNDGDIEGQF